MFRTQLSFVCTLALASSMLLNGCSAPPVVDKTINMSPNAIYAEAQETISAGAYDKGILLLEKLEGRAAGTPLAQQAQIDKAYAHYKAQEPAQALATLDRFIKLNPASPVLDYAFYLKGIINFNEDLGLFSAITRQDLAERDQKAAKESFEAFKQLVTRFPASKYAADAQLRMSYITNSLAQYEIYVAQYYYSRGAYVAAINRAQTALSDFRDVPALEEALFILVKSYEALGMPQLRDDAKRVLTQNYPNSEYITQGFKAKPNPWWKLW
jgi:outer membrane protein assembly factor BamD